MFRRILLCPYSGFLQSEKGLPGRVDAGGGENKIVHIAGKYLSVSLTLCDCLELSGVHCYSDSKVSCFSYPLSQCVKCNSVMEGAK
jgi:hypothetical protein